MKLEYSTAANKNKYCETIYMACKSQNIPISNNFLHNICQVDLLEGGLILMCLHSVLKIIYLKVMYISYVVTCPVKTMHCMFLS